MVSISTPVDFLQDLSEPRVHVLVDRCSGCQECIVRCPTGALALDNLSWIVQADDSLCVGCRQCERTCPFSAIYVAGPLKVAPIQEQLVDLKPISLVGNSEEVIPGYRDIEEMMQAAQRCLSCPDPTCVLGCPAHNDIPGFIKAARDGNLEAAAEILSINSCLPAACSRVCDWDTQCQASCTWTLAGGKAVEIGRIERYIADNAAFSANVADVCRDEVDIAVVGAGPAGIGAAYELNRNGARVSVYEADSEAGGVMRWGIPTYVLPSGSWSCVVKGLEQSGVDFHYNHPVDPHDQSQLLREHDAVIFASGASLDIIPKIEGMELAGVENATAFLNMAKFILAMEKSEPILQGKRVLVLGAGNTAMDVARSVLRLGGSAIAVDWMNERFTRARPDEISDARAEGVDVRFLTTVTKIIANAAGNVGSAVLTSTHQDTPSEVPKICAGSDETLGVDLVVTAMGYRVDGTWNSLSRLLELGKTDKRSDQPRRNWIGSGLFAVTTATARLAFDREFWRIESAFPVARNTWAVGDLRVGPSTVVSSMAQGMSAARGVLSELKRDALKTGVIASSKMSHLAVGKALLIHDGASENVKGCAESIGSVFLASGWNVTILDGENLNSLELLGVDIIIYGSEADGVIFGNAHPSHRALEHIEHLPLMYGKKVATYVVQSFLRGNADRELMNSLSKKGADVLIGRIISPRKLSHEATIFAQDVLEDFQCFQSQSG